MKPILVADQKCEFRNQLQEGIQGYNFPFEIVSSRDELLSRIAANQSGYSLILMNSEPEGPFDFDVVEEVEAVYPFLPVVAVSDSLRGNVADQGSRAVRCVVLSKSYSAEQLLAAISDAAGPLERDLMESRKDVSTAQREELLTTGTWSQRVESLLIRIGSSNVPVLLQGETGVGKEVIARRLHALSRRADRPFVKLNCAALPSELVESELFGYERGAFTGAFKSTPGKFEMAHKGTILLDEIGDMDVKLQAKLLQVLQDQEFYRLGSHEPSRIDVRIMAASHCDFEKAIQEKRFREDLFYRLNIVDVKIPPLRERRNEILPLCELFLQRHAAADSPALDIPPILRQVLLEYNWPGNVRELENMMRKYLVLRSPGVLAADIRQRTVKAKTVYVPADEMAKSLNVLNEVLEDPALSRRLPDMQRWKPETGKGALDISSHRASTPREGAGPQELPKPTPINRAAALTADQETTTVLSKVDEARKMAEADAILSALHSCQWNRKRAAVVLNIDYKALLYKMKKLGIGEKRTAS